MWRALAALLVLTACSRAESTLVVGAASSLAETATELGQAFEPGLVELSVAGSQVLVAQVREGAPLDVVITADARTARTIASLEAAVGEPEPVAGNRLAIAVAEGNPLGIERLQDLARDDLTVVLASPDVPAGNYTRQLLSKHGLELQPDSLEPSVRGVLTKVRLGEADAGIVYQTDLSVGGVTGVAFPESSTVDVEYYAVALAGGPNPEAALAFVEFLQGTEAETIFVNRGFTR